MDKEVRTIVSGKQMEEENKQEIFKGMEFVRHFDKWQQSRGDGEGERKWY